MKPTSLDLGTHFDTLAARGTATRLLLDRPLDIAPDGGRRYTMAGIATLVAEAAGWLAAAGVRRGDRVAIAKPNHLDQVLLACAAARLGALPALLSDELPAETLRLLLARLDPRALVTATATLARAAGSGVDLTTSAERVVGLDTAPGTAGIIGLDELRGHRAPPVYRPGPHAPLIVHHTSGTTGVPKLVVHSTNTILHRLAGFEARRWPVLSARPDDVAASAVPFCHGRAIPWTISVSWLGPAAMLAVSDRDPARATRFLADNPPTVLETDPAGYVRWMPWAAGRDSPFRAVRMYVSTFDAVHPPTVRTYLAASRRRHPLWMQGWGQTETGPLTFRFLTRRSLSTVGRRHPTTRNLGRPVPGRTRVRVVDPVTLSPLPAGRLGLVQVSTAARCLDYLGESNRWRAKVDGGWWNTGDLGALTGTGAVLLADREVDHVPGMSCLELEDVIEDRLSQVLECTVLGVPGERPLPVLVTRDGEPVPVDGWRAAVADLPRFAPPVTMRWDELPRTGTGKVRRAPLRERLADPAASTPIVIAP